MHPSPRDLPRGGRAILGALRRGACSVTDIEHLTGLSQLTVRRYLDALEAQRLVAPDGLGRSRGGRRPRLYTLIADSCLVLAVHLRFPGAGLAMVALDGSLVETRRVPATGDEDPVTVVGRLAQAAELLRQSPGASRVIGAGIALPGYADLSRGISLRIGRAPAWRDVPLGEGLGRRLGLPTLLVHDTAAMALAEHEVGDARGEQHFAFVLAEEGVSAGLFLDGAVYQGLFGNAGLIGHIVARPGGRPCYCGNLGCVESYASTRALIERPRELAPGAASESLTPSEVIGRALEGREPYRTVLADALDALGIAIANLAKVLELRTVSIGGYPASLPDPVRARVADITRAHLLPPLRTAFEIRYSRIREAGLVGAAVLVIRRFLEMPAAQ